MTEVFRATPDPLFERVIEALASRPELALPFESKAKAQRVRYLFYVARMQAAKSGDPLWGRRISVRVEQREGAWFTVFYPSGFDTALAKALAAAGLPPDPSPLDEPEARPEAEAGEPRATPPTDEEPHSSLIDAIRAVTKGEQT